MKNISRLNQVFLVELILFILIVTSVLPRWFALVLAGILVIYAISASTEDATILFLRSIPLFLALPITASFDNFNTWRLLALIIFLKWAVRNTPRPPLKLQGGLLPALLCIISILSVLVAHDKAVAIKRIIYFINLSLIPIVIFDLVQRIEGFSRRMIKNLAIPLFIVLIAGFLQLISTYRYDIYQFIDFWGWGVQCGQYGMEWCRIAVEKGNTWFAYNSFGQINLRMFSLFTDSHTFPLFILMTLPAVFAIGDFPKLRKILFVVPFAFLAVILSNTRGMWLAGWVIALIAFVVALFWKDKMIRYFATWMIAFLMLFAFVYPISATPQFHLWAGKATLITRIHSIIDFAETSNKLRIAIWQASAKSILHHPFIGVGIGNFPVVLNQDIELAKAGSSAHNLYLHIGAELGIPALLIALLFLFLILCNTYIAFRDTLDPFHRLYFGGLLLCIPWVLMYLVTDAALFDERAFLIFFSVSALTLAYVKPARIS